MTEQARIFIEDILTIAIIAALAAGILSFLTGCGTSPNQSNQIQAGNQSQITNQQKQSADQGPKTSGEVSADTIQQTTNSLDPKYMLLSASFLIGLVISLILLDKPQMPIYVTVGGWILALSAFGVVIVTTYLQFL